MRHTVLVALVAIGIAACAGGSDEPVGSAADTVEPAATRSSVDDQEPDPALESAVASDWDSGTDYLRDRDDRAARITRLFELTAEAIRAHAGEQTAAVLAEASLAAGDLVRLFEDRTPPDGFGESHDLLVESWRVTSQHFDETASAFRIAGDGPAFRAALRQSEDSLLESHRLKQASDRALP